MHLLATRPGSVSDGSDAVDLGQRPGDIVVLSAADSELACLAAARARLEAGERVPQPAAGQSAAARPSDVGRRLRRANVGTGAAGRRAAARRPQLLALRRRADCGDPAANARSAVAFLPGDDQPDAELAALSSLPPDAQHRLWRYLVEGGIDNAVEFLRYAASLIGGASGVAGARPLLHAGLYWPDGGIADLATLRAAALAARTRRSRRWCSTGRWCRPETSPSSMR